jgi:sigma-B regulation protein RsbU (phosphoserine phosphatase)
MGSRIEAVSGADDNSSEKAAKGAGKIRFGLRMKFSLAIIVLVATVLLTMSIYFVLREIRLLRSQIFESVQRELVHLSNTAQESIGVDELAIIASISDLKKLDYLSYAFVLNARGEIIQYFDNRAERAVGAKPSDGVERDLEKRKENVNPGIVEYDDPRDPAGTIFDFSRPVLNKFDRKNIGYVAIGLSDIIIRREVANVYRIIGLISLAFLGLSIVGAVILSSVTIKPIRKLSRGAAIIGQGDLDYRIEIRSSDELGMLAREFNHMTSQIKEAKNKEIENRIMEEQLELARDIQEGLNPMGYYEKDGIQIKGYTRAAKGVGGDYFDYIDIDENRVGALISDVSGKGVPASLVMVMIRTVFTTYVRRPDVDCSSVVTAINDSLSSDFAIDKFATLFFMIYDRKTEELSFTNAGHAPLYCYRAKLGAFTATQLDGVPIGIMEDVQYKQGRIRLNPGDIVIMFSDGVSEMRNMNKDEYGLERVHKMLLENHHLSAKDFVEKLVAEVNAFQGEAPQHDDMTMLVFKREA